MQWQAEQLLVSNSMTQLETPAGGEAGSLRGQAGSPAEHLGWGANSRGVLIHSPPKSNQILAGAEMSTLDFDFHTRFVRCR